MKNIFFIIILVFMYCNLFAQPNQDARMLGLNGAYTTLAKGYQCIGINPANLASYKTKSANIFNMSMGLSTNSLSIANYNAINGADLENTLAINYFPKSEFYDIFGGKGIRLIQILRIPAPLLNFSTRHIGLSTNLITNIDMGIPNGFVDLLLYGNPFGKNISIDIEQFIFIAEEMGFSYGHSFKSFSAGFTLKYILGLFYMGMESIEEPYIITNYTSLTGKNQYLIQQAIGGAGTGLDLGFTTHESKDGYRFGISVINLLGKVEWTQDHFMRSSLESTLEKSAGDFYFRPNEFMYVNMTIDEMTGTNLDVIYYEMYKVMPLEAIETLDISSQDSTLLIPLSDGTYLYPSGGEYKLNYLMGDGDTTFTTTDNYNQFSIGDNNPFITRQPIYLRMGISRRWEGQAVVAADLVTGFSDRFGSSSSWRLSIGTEITRFKNKFLRLGYAFGGLSKKSMSIGYGRQIGNFYWDSGISFNGGFSIETAKGIDIAIGFTWQKM